MITQILNPDDALYAREMLNLSQAKVAKDTGLSRSYLSQYESGKRVLEDKWMRALKGYYENLGWVAPEPKEPDEMDVCLVRSRDGFVISEDLTDKTVESLLDEYYSNAERIEGIQQSELRRGFFGGIDEENSMKSVLAITLLSHRQFIIKQLLHGQLENDPISQDLETNDIETMGQYVNYLFNSNFRDEAA